ncbi:MAG: polysaccharide deacetylase family protein [Clostridia bacterium]|nr:polysaccharide deacetylase family protein [Clostridia bacterium]
MNEEELEKQIGLEEQEEITEEIEQEESESGGIVKEESKELEEAKIRYELVNKNVFKRDTIYKVVTFASLAIVVMASSSIAGIMFASSSKKKIEEKTEETPVVVEEEKKEVKLPQYTEEAKERMKTIYDNTGDEKIAYLTFDDGPSEKITPQVLDILKNEEVKATFFLLGSRVELYPDLVKREFEEGHYIANHGYSHVYTSIYSSAQAVLDEYNKTEEKIKEALQIPEYSSHLFRFPGGSEGGKYKKVKNDAKGVLESNNIAFINWNCLTNDSVGKPTYESIIKDFKITQNRKKQDSCSNA